VVVLVVVVLVVVVVNIGGDEEGVSEKALLVVEVLVVVVNGPKEGGIKSGELEEVDIGAELAAELGNGDEDETEEIFRVELVVVVSRVVEGLAAEELVSEEKEGED
jgi:hypothetical protein